MNGKTKSQDHDKKDEYEESKVPLVTSSIKGATFLILLQIGARALTFAVNQVLIRHLSPELLGVSTQLELYQISVLYFARESLRVALQRQVNETEVERSHVDDEEDASKDKVSRNAIQAESLPGKAQTIINLSYISILLGILLAVVLAKLYLQSTSSSSLALQTPWFRESLQLYGIAAFLELLAEPCFILAQHKLLYKVRAGAESAATLAKCLATCIFALLAARKKGDVGVLPFAVGQMAYALVLLAFYYWSLRGFASNEGFSLMIKPIDSRNNSQYIFSYLSRPLLSLGGSIFIQSAVKHLLTQGDSFLIATLASLRDQGIYALTSNYGGLIARTLFQPIEESSRNLFSKLLSSRTGINPDKSRVRTAATVLSTTLRLYILLTILAISLGPSLGPILLQLIAGSKWISSGAGRVLGTYSYYIPLLALNGITEAFVSAVATPAELHAQSIWMFAFSLGFAGAGLVFLRLLNWGAQGLVWANVVNMLLRVVWSSSFIRRYFHRNGVGFDFKHILPTPGAVAVGVGLVSVASRMDDPSTDAFVKLIGLVSIGGAAVLLIALFERVFVKQCLDMLDSSSTTSKRASMQDKEL